jgi:quercetin dioxygenase-like cupin family protein
VLFASWEAPAPASLGIAPTAELILFVARGGGRLRRDGDGGTPLRAGHALFVPPGEACAIDRATDDQGLVLVGFVTGATSVDAAGLLEGARG